MGIFGFWKKRKDGKTVADRMWREAYPIEARYKPILEKHFQLIETYERLYSTALKVGVNSSLMNNVVQLCEEDMALSPKIKSYCKAIGDPLYTLPAYKRLAILYAKRGDYDRAIKVCEDSIRIGNHVEEFESRKAKLIQIRKKESQCEAQRLT